MYMYKFKKIGLETERKIKLNNGKGTIYNRNF